VEIGTTQRGCRDSDGRRQGRQFENTDAVEVPYLRVANVQDGHLDLSEMKTLEIRRAELERYTLHDGDVVLTEVEILTS